MKPCLLVLTLLTLAVACVPQTPTPTVVPIVPAPTATVAPTVAAPPTLVPTPTPAAMGNQPPTIMVRAGGQEQQAALGSYCWPSSELGAVCADVFALLIPSKPITVSPGADLSFHIMGPAPSALDLKVFTFELQGGPTNLIPPNRVPARTDKQLDHVAPGPATAISYKAPALPAHYVLSLFGYWRDPATGNEHANDASYGFNLVVADSSPSGAGSSTVKGRIVAGYGDHSPITGLPLWIGTESHGGPVATSNAQGEFTIANLPAGLWDVVDSHLSFQVPVATTDATVDLGVLKYPLMHPPTYYYWAPPTISLADLSSQSQVIPFSVCQTDPAWSRPIESVQRDKVWSKRPFSDHGEQILAWWLRQAAVLYDTQDIYEQGFPDGPNLDAVGADWRYLLGLWTSQALSASKCAYDGPALNDLLNRKSIEIWLLGYGAQEVRRLEMPYSLSYNKPITEGHPDFLKIEQPSEQFVVRVSPAPGWQIIRFEGHMAPLLVHVIADGKELVTLPTTCRSRPSSACEN